MAAYPMGGLHLTFNLKPNNIFRPTNKICFVCKLEIVKYFNKMTLFGGKWPKI
jgi:hypothetical protein